MERSMTPQQAPSAPYGAPMGAPMPARSGFGSALLGGLLGVGLGSMLFGHGFGFGGGFGFIGLLLQLALLFFVGRWIFRMVFGRGQPLMAGMPRMGQPAPQMMGQPVGMGGTAGAASGRAIQVGPGDFQAFEQLLQQVQAAWSSQDMRALQQIATPEMVSYFGEQLAEQASRGVRNTVTDVKLEKGDLSEAWSEGSREYATVAMRFSMIDVTRDSAGRVVDGALAERVLVTELWTFVRAPGGRWLLSAIQQGR
jgi:predicted lipid-binding transport protein (Tim44 family)